MHFWQRFDVTVAANIYLNPLHWHCAKPHGLPFFKCLVVIHLKKETRFWTAVCVVTMEEGSLNIVVYISDR